MYPTARDLYERLGMMMLSGDVDPDSEIIVAHHTTGPEGLIEDLYYWGLDWIWSAPTDEDGEEAKKVLVIEAYNQPLK